MFTRSQARGAGWSDYRNRRRLDDGRWSVLLGDGLREAGQPLTSEAVAWTTHLSVPHGVVSHLTAGWLHGLPLRAELQKALAEGRAGHLLVTRQCRVRGVVAHRSWTPFRPVRRNGLPATDRSRSAIDCLAVLPRDRAIDLWGWLSTRGVLDRSQLAAAARARFGREGTPNLLAVLALGNTGAASVAERRLHDLLRRAGITGWTANEPVRVDGTIVAVADVLFPAHRLVVEVDGWASHGGRDAFVQDRRRQNALVNAGYRVLRFTWDDLVNRAGNVLAEIGAALKITA